MTNRIKEEFGYKLNYNIRLNKGKTFKANNELRIYKEKYKTLSETDCDEEDEEDLQNKIKKVRAKIEAKKEILKILEEEKQELLNDKKDFDLGNMDENFNTELLKKIETKEERKNLRKEKIESIKSENKGLSQEFYNRNRETAKQEKYNLKNLNYEYKYFVEKGETLPPPYTKKLKNMKNSDGYLWKRIYFYGELPVEDDDNTRTIYELFKDKIIIHKKDEEGNWSSVTKMKKKKDKKESKKENKKENKKDKKKDKKIEIDEDGFIKYSKNHNFKFKNL